jgi:hypothetical protein
MYRLSFTLGGGDTCKRLDCVGRNELSALQRPRLLRRHFAVGLERDLRDFDATTPPKVDHSDGHTWPWHPLELLHDEAKKLSDSSEWVALAACKGRPSARCVAGRLCPKSAP